MSAHAGFWIDGAVREPENKHFDCNEWVVAKWKAKTLDLDICRKNFDKWREVYWLDTTPRESLTPEELFSVVRVIWPKCENVFDPGVNASVRWQVQLDETNEHTPINWGNLTQYPPHAEPQWLRITRENVGQYLFRYCRFRDSDSQEWRGGKVAGWCETDDNCLVNRYYSEDVFVMQWDVVEVQS